MMRPLCIAFFLGLAAASCPSGWTAAPNNICYKRSHGLKNFKGCYESCTAIGGTPPCIRSNDHKDILIGMVDGNHFFTGAYQEPGTLGDHNTRNGWHDGTLGACGPANFDSTWQWSLDPGYPTSSHFDDWTEGGANCGQENCAFLLWEGDPNTVHDIGCADEIDCVCERNLNPGANTSTTVPTALLNSLIDESRNREGFSCPRVSGRGKGFPIYLIGPMIGLLCCAFWSIGGLMAMSRAKRSAAERERNAAARVASIPMQPIATNVPGGGMAVATATAIPSQPGALPVAQARVVPMNNMPVAQAVVIPGGMMPAEQATVVSQPGC